MRNHPNKKSFHNLINCFPNCSARSSVLKQSREPKYAYADEAVRIALANTNPAALSSYTNQGKYLYWLRFEKSGIKLSTLFQASAMVNNLFKALSAFA